MIAYLKRIAQALRSTNRHRLDRRRAGAGLTYAEWIQRYDTLNEEVLQTLQRRMANLPSNPVISVLMPVYNPNVQWLDEAIRSVQQQIYPHWQLCIADDCSTDPAVRHLLQAAADSDARIRLVFRAQNGHICKASQSALDVADGEFVALLDHDDMLPAHALLLNAEAIAQFPRALVLYSDEDLLRFDGQRQSPNFKPDWNPELMRSQNMICHLGVYQTALVRQVGGFQPGLEGAQDYDLALRCLEQAADDQVLHIPHVLYHWRQHSGSSSAGDGVKPYIVEAGRLALQQHLDRQGESARAEASAGGGYRVHLPAPDCSVGVVVDSAHGLEALARCLKSLLQQSVGHRLTVLVSITEQTDSVTRDWLNGRASDPRIELRQLGAHRSCANTRNLAAQGSHAELLGFVDSRVELATVETLAELLALAHRVGTGVVGAKVLTPDHRLIHGAWLLGQGRAQPLMCRGMDADSHGYRSRAVLNQNLAAVGAWCLALRREVFESAGGFDSHYVAADLAAVDLCLAAAARQQRTVWAAHAPVLLHGFGPCQQPQAPGVDSSLPDRQRLVQRWGSALDADPAYSAHLSLEAADFSCAPEPRVSLQQAWFANKLGLPEHPAA